MRGEKNAGNKKTEKSEKGWEREHLNSRDNISIFKTMKYEKSHYYGDDNILGKTRGKLELTDSNKRFSVNTYQKVGCFRKKFLSFLFIQVFWLPMTESGT